VQLQRLLLRNFRQHADKEIVFPPGGVIVIGGPNGCGKSSIIYALYFALTGNNPTGTKIQNLKWGEEEGGVTLDFSVDGANYQITRNLHNATVLLAIPSGERIRKAEQVKQLLTQLLGLDSKPSLLDKLVFSFQGQLTSNITRTNAEQIKFFHELFGTDRYERLYERLGVVSVGIRVDAPLETVEAVSAKCSAIELEQSTLAQQIQQVAADLAKYNIDELKAKLNAQQVAANECVAASAIQLKQTTLEESLVNEILQVNKISAEIKKIEEAINNNSAPYNEAQKLLAKYEDIEKIEGYRKLLLSRARELEAEGLKRANPEQFEFRDEWAESERVALERIRSNLEHCKRTIENFASGCCPTCGTTKIIDVSGSTIDLNQSIPEHRRNYEQLSRELQTRATVYESYQRAANDARTRIDEYQRWHSKWSNEVSSIALSINSLPPAQTLPVLDSLKKLIAEQTSLIQQQGQLTAVLNAHKTKCAELRGFLDALNDQYEKVYAVAKTYDQGEAERLQKTLSECNEIQRNYTYLVGRATQLSSELANVHGYLRQVIEGHKQAEKRVHYRNDVDKLRQLFHRNNLPLTIIQSKFQQLNAKWNSLLDSFDVPFSAELSTEGNILFGFGNQFATVSQLSGGQLCCAALSFLLALKELFAHDVGFIVLDEPTYGLDSDRLARVADVLSVTNQLAVSARMQVIVVTHEEQLKTGFAVLDC